MKTIVTVTTVLLFSLGSLLAEERTWTSADGSKTFQGSLRSYDSGSGVVSVVTSEGRLLNFTADKLSEADREFLASAKPGTTSAPAAAGPDPETEVGKKVAKARLQRLDGERYKRAELEKTPEYYLFYYSASW